MKLFTQLYRRIDSTTSVSRKVSALVDYFNEASDSDKLWTIALFTHRRPRRTIQTALLRTWAAEIAGLPQWLFEESYHTVGDLAETIALVLPEPKHSQDKSLTEWIKAIIDQREKDENEKKHFVLSAWASMEKDERFLFNKLITGGFRIGVSQKLMTRALATFLEKEENHVAHRLMGQWSPADTDFESLLVRADWQDDLSKPYPFFLAYALERELVDLGPTNAWAAEWKWDGIRAQLIKRKGVVFVWSRGEELITDTFPEFKAIREVAADNFVLDGEIVVHDESGVRPFNHLQKRLGRKKVSRKMLQDYPVKLLAYDLLEYEGQDIRIRPYAKRREYLNEILFGLQEKAEKSILLSEEVTFDSWIELKDVHEKARSLKAEGLMLKEKNSGYLDGRRRGGWWKWKVDPFTIDAVMLYAQRGHGRRSNLFTDFTFAVWDDSGSLVPFAKAYSGLTDSEFAEVTNFVNRNTIERFGPVRSVVPELVFELAFEGINTSKRHKSGVALRFPRIRRWRKDKLPSEANNLADLKALLEVYGE